LSTDGKHKLKSQITSVMLAQDTILNILKYISLISNGASKEFYYKKYFTNKKSLLDHKEEILTSE